MSTQLSSIIFYILAAMWTGLLLALSQYLCKKEKGIFLGKFLLLISFLIPFIIASIRYGVGTDYFNYVDMYNRIFMTSLWDNLKLIEPGYILINFIAKFVFQDVQFVFIFCSFLTLLFIYLAALDNFKKEGAGLAVFIFMCTGYLTMLCIVRQALAGAIILYAFKYMYERKFYKYALFVLIACLFHYSAILLLPFYFLGVRQLSIVGFKSKKIKGIVVVLITTAVLFMKQIMVYVLAHVSFLSKYQYYFTGSDQVSSLLNIVDKLPFLIFLLIFGRKIMRGIPRSSSYIWMFIIGLLFESSSPELARLISYFSQSLIIILPLFSYIFDKKINVIVIKSGVILYGLLYLYFFYLYGPGETMGAIPYTTLWGWQP